MAGSRTFEGAVDADGAFHLLPHAEAAFKRYAAERPGQRMWIEAKTGEQLHSDRQRRYWFAAVVGTFRDVWERELGYLIPKEAVHDRLVAVFGGGLVDTPLGKARTDTKLKSMRAMNEMIEEAREYALHEYGRVIPSGEEWYRMHGEDAA